VQVGDYGVTIQETVQRLQYTPLTYRIQVIGFLLQLLKGEIIQSETVQAMQKHFCVQTFDMGADVTIDWGEMYAARVA